MRFEKSKVEHDRIMLWIDVDTVARIDQVAEDVSRQEVIRQILKEALPPLKKTRRAAKGSRLLNRLREA